MQARLRVLGMVGLIALVAACGPTRDGAAPQGLSAPSTAVVDTTMCEDEQVLASKGTLGFRRVGVDCLRNSSVLEVPSPVVGRRLRALAATPSRLMTPAELFNWAEVTYAVYFPSRRSNQVLGPFTYRYYPETQNHVAVADGKVYIQGPISGGELALVGTLEELTCIARPDLCGIVSADCAPISDWTVGANRCVPNSGQSPRIADGVTYTFVDSTGPTTGAATYRCTNGSLNLLQPSTCDLTEVGCTTAGLSWRAGTAVCTPNPNEPTQIPSGATYTFADSVSTTGRATYLCTNGNLSPIGTPTCTPPPPVHCTPGTVNWTVQGNVCTATTVPSEVADGATYEFADWDGSISGSAVFQCTQGQLAQVGTPVCGPLQRMADSFGGDGGASDGGASGDGTAGDGAPIVGGLVRVVDVAGRQVTTTTDSRGYWRVKLTGMTPPFVISVTRTDGKVRRSVSTQALRPNGYIFMAVTGITDKITSDLAARALGGPVSPAALTPTLLRSLGPTAVNDAVVALRNNTLLRPQLIAAGLNPDTFDPLSTPFRTDRTGYDRVLDNLSVITNPDGSTSLLPINCVVPDLSWQVAGTTCNVPSPRLQINNGVSVIFSDTVGPTFGSATFTCNGGQLSGPTNASCTTPVQTASCEFGPNRTWSVGVIGVAAPFTCSTGFVTQVQRFASEGEQVGFVDTDAPNTGAINFICRSGSLVEVSKTCGPP